MSDDPTRLSSSADPGSPEGRVKVTDRRRFDRSGELRPGATAEDETPPRPGPTPSAPAPEKKAPEARREVGADRAAPGSVGPRTASGPDRGAPGSTRGGVDFQGFVYFLYMSALHELGLPTEPGAPAGRPDLERARFFIDVLQLLEEKTRGNLLPGEGKLLDEILYNVRMQYVTVAQGR